LYWNLNKLNISSNTPLCLQEISTQERIDTRVYADQLGQQLDTRITNMAVSFMNPAGVTVVVTVRVNFQIQIVLDL
jgi:hypothetical protein